MPGAGREREMRVYSEIRGRLKRRLNDSPEGGMYSRGNARAITSRLRGFGHRLFKHALEQFTIMYRPFRGGNARRLNHVVAPAGIARLNSNTIENDQ